MRDDYTVAQEKQRESGEGGEGGGHGNDYQLKITSDTSCSNMVPVVKCIRNNHKLITCGHACMNARASMHALDIVNWWVMLTKHGLSELSNHMRFNTITSQTRIHQILDFTNWHGVYIVAQ